MIITENGKLAEAEDAQHTTQIDAGQDDPPPVYTPSETVGPVSDSSSSTAASLPLPVNHFTMSRDNGAIKGTYVVDPLLVVPEPLRPQLELDETVESRKNLKLRARNGSVNAEIHVVGDKTTDDDKVDSKGLLDEFLRRKKTTLDVSSNNGAVAVRLHAPTIPRSPLSVKLSTSNGALTLEIPRSFHGPLSLSTRNGTIDLSRELSACTTTFSEVQGTKTCFVGDFSVWKAGGSPAELGEGLGWAGDEATLKTKNGRIKVMFVDEQTSKEGGERKGLTGFFRSLGF